MQGAADAAAYSGAVVQAQALASVAAMNQVMVWIARAALGLIAAVTTLGVLVALNAVLPGAFAWAVPLFTQAVTTAAEWLPKLRGWAERLARAEDRVAQTTPALVMLEIDRIARANGAARGLGLPTALPLVPEPQPARFAARAAGVPGWAFGALLGKGTGISRGAEAGGRHVTRSEGDIGQGVSDPRARLALGKYRRILADLAKEPWPMPRVLDRRFDTLAVTVAALPPAQAFRAPIWPDRWTEPARLPFVAAARPFHPDLPASGADASPDNLYPVDGWTAELVPVRGRRFPLLDPSLLRWMEH